jgi:exonuclease III
MPDPAVIGDQTASTGTESIIFTIALDDSRRIVNVRFADLCKYRINQPEKEQGENHCSYKTGFHKNLQDKILISKMG